MAAVLYRLRCRLRADIGRVVLLAVLIALVTGGLLVLAAGTHRTLTVSDRYAATLGQHVAAVQQDHGLPRTAELRRLPHVRKVDAMTFVFGALTRGGSSQPLDSLVFAGTPHATGARLAEGRLPRSTEEFTATRSLVRAAHLRLGQRLQLVTISRKTASERGFDAPEPDGPSFSATLVGVLDEAATDLLQDATPLVIFPASLLDAGDIGSSATVGVIAVDAHTSVASLRREIAALPDAANLAVERQEWVPKDVRNAITAQGEGLAVVTIVAAVAAVIVLAQLLVRQLRLGADERLALRSTGMTRAQVLSDPLAHAVVPVLAGVVGGTIAAYVASGSFPTGFVRHVEPDPGRRFDAGVHIGAAMAIAITVLVATGLALAFATRRRAPERTSRAVDALASVAPPGAATALRFGFGRRADSGSGRGALLGTVAVLAVLIGALTFGTSLRALVDRPHYWGNNFDVGLGQGGDALPDGARAALQRSKDITAFTLFGTTQVGVDAEAFELVGVDPVRGGLVPEVLDGRLPRGNDEVALGRVLARRLHVGPGDELVVRGSSGPVRFRLTGLVVVPGVEGADGVGEDGVVTMGGLHRLDPAAGASAAAARVRPGLSARAARARITRAVGMAAGPLTRPSVIANAARVRGVPYLVAATLAVLALLSLGHQLIVSSERRRRDLAVLRALGADRRWVTSVVHWQSTLYTAAVLVVAMPIGMIAGRVVYRSFVGRIGALPTVNVPWLGFAISAVALLVLANVATAPTARRVRRRSPASVLMTE